jgi:dipeptidyl aminopeptidase/acylaminoacyl peptidase
MLSASRGRRAARRTALGVALALLSLLAAAASAAAPAGPRLAVVKITWKPERGRLITVGPDGGAPVKIAGGHEHGPLSLFDFGPLSWRPDGAELALTADFGLYLAGADRSGLRRINAARAERPVFAPDGRTLAFTRRGRSEFESEIWTIDLATWRQRQLTPSRPGLEYIATSFSPDGRTLLASRTGRHPRGESEPVAIDLASGRVTQLLAHDGFQATYSPDGSQIALLRREGRRMLSDLFVLDVASGRLRRLTRSEPGFELFPSWDPSGERIAFARFRGYHFEWANSIVQINADGTCETEMLARRRTIFYGPAWQPGPGREAGRIECRGRGHR